MDVQHQKWIALIDNFSQVSTGNAPRESIEAVLLKLLDYTRSHFVSEEAFLAEHHYPELAAHKEMHRLLVDHVLHLLAELKASKSRMTESKLNFLVTSWLLEHIKQEDRKYAEFISA